MNIKDIGQEIKKRRKLYGMTQVEAAGLCNVGIRFLSELENGKASLHIGKVFKVIDAFGLEIVIKERSL